MTQRTQRNWHARSARKQVRRQTRALALEHLEDRATPAAIGWDGGGGDLNWFNPTNWNTDSLPTLTDDVTISGAAGAVAINDPAGVAAAGTLTSSSNLSVIAGTLQLAGNSVITGAFTNSGSVAVTGGSLTVGAGSSAGDIQLAGGATLVVTSGLAQPFVLLDGATVAGGAIVIDRFGGTNAHLGVSGTVAVDEVRFSNPGNLFSELNVLAGGQLTVKTLDQVGIVNGAGTIIVTDRWLYKSSFLRGTGVLINQGLATFNFPLIERTVENTGTAIVDPRVRVVFLDNGSWINRPGSLFEMRTDSVLVLNGLSPRFTNQGTLLKTATGSATIELPLVNEAAGTVRVAQGNLVLTAAGSSAGTFDLLTGNTLQLTRSFTLEAGATSVGPGELRVTGDTSNILTVAGATSLANLRYEAGTMNVNAPLTVANLTQTGETFLTGPADLTVSGAFSWQQGIMTGTGKTFLNGTGTITVPLGSGGFSGPWLDTRTVDNAGTITLTTASVFDPFKFTGTATWNNLPGSVLQLSGLVNVTATPANVFNNAGTLRKTAASAGNFRLRLVNTGRFEILAGDLTTAADSRSSGVVDIAANARWVLPNTGTTFLDAGATTTGAGRVFIPQSASLTVTGAATIARLEQNAGATSTVNAPLTIGDYLFNGGTLTGTGKTTLTGLSTFSNSGSGTVSNHTVDNAGTVTVQGLAVQLNNAVFNNLAGAVLSASNGGTFSGSVGSVAFNNAGTVRKIASPSGVSIGVPFVNTGRVEILGGDLSTAANLRNSGVVDIAASGRWVLNSPSSAGTTFLEAGATITGPGLVFMQSGTLAVNADISIPRLQQNAIAAGSTVTVNSPLTIGNYTFNGGTLTGPAKTTLTGASTVTSGTAKTISNHTVDNAGTVTRTIGGLFQLTNAAFNNLPGAVFDVSTNTVSFVAASGTGGFNNAGTLRKTGNPAATWEAPLANTGTVEVVAGDLRLITAAGGPALTNTGTVRVGITPTTNAIVSFPPAYTLAGGTLTGTGRVNSTNLTIGPDATLSGSLTVVGNVINRGTVSPASTAAPLTVSGNYTQVDDTTADGRLVIGLRGDSGSGLFGKLQVNGQSSLAGPLDAFADGAFLPDFGDVFEVFRSFGPRTGDFTYPPDGYDLDGYRVLTHEYDGTGLRLRLITEVGDLPVIDPIADVTVNEGQTVHLTATVTGAEPPGPLTFSLSAGSSPGASINPTTGEFEFFAPAGPAEYVFQVNVSDPNAPTDPVDVETFMVTVLNVAPTVSISGGQSQLNEGDQFTATGSFTDPGADVWTATVDYGDGTGVSPLTLNPDKSFALDHRYLDNGDFNVTVRVFDGHEYGEATFAVAVANLAPTVTAADDQATEEATAHLFELGAFTDFGLSDAPWTVEVNWGDGSAPLTFDVLEQGLLDPNPHTYADSGTYTVTVRVIDKDGGIGSDSFLVTVGNLAPVASVTGPASGVRGQARTFTLSATDPSSIDQAAGFSFAIDWGDGSTQAVTGASGLTVEHTFAEATTYTVTVTATDKDGGTSAAATHAISVLVTEVQAGVLVIGGTTGTDSIQVKKGAGDGSSLDVTINGVHLGETGLTRAVVYGQAGDDDLDATGSTDLALELYGGGGNDHLKGGAKDDILDGGAGDDELFGGLGRDVLIGGSGTDRLVSQSGDDILIGALFMGNDLTEARHAALLTVSTQWSSSAVFADRVAALTAYLTARVQDDGVADYLTGSSGNDWYFARTTGSASELDVLSGASSQDAVTSI
jgi:PKD domain/RTX calcium-binding nonapeptide repeat (4 copies)